MHIEINKMPHRFRSKSKFKVYNYDINLKIVLFLELYNRLYNCKYKITSSALNKLDKFLTIFSKTVLVNSCLISLYKNRSGIYYWTTVHVASVIMRGYEINISNFEQEYNFITNPLNDFGPPIFEIQNYGPEYYAYKGHFTDALDQIMSKIINCYGESKINKGDHALSDTLVSILLVLLKQCTPSDNQGQGQEQGQEQEQEQVIIIDDKMLYKFSELEDIIKIDNVLGGNDILKFDVPEFSKQSFDEIKIDDLVHDNIEEKMEYADKHKLRYRGYPEHLDQLVIDE